MIDISGIPKARLLKELYDLADEEGAPLQEREAKALVEHRRKTLRKLLFVRVNDRALFVDISGDGLDGREYDKTHGVRAAQRAVDRARKRGK